VPVVTKSLFRGAIGDGIDLGVKGCELTPPKRPKRELKKTEETNKHLRKKIRRKGEGAFGLLS